MWIAIITIMTFKGVAITSVNVDSSKVCFEMKTVMERKNTDSAYYSVDCFSKK